MKKPYGSIIARRSCALKERKLIRIFEPSSGGRGIKLKAPRIIFILTTIGNITDKTELARMKLSCNKNSAIIAISIFVKQPAKATENSPKRLLLKLE